MHVGIIMDGNGRWAVSRGLPRLAGHKHGATRVQEIVRACPALGVTTLTLYAFSTENWNRSPIEVDGLMRLFRRHLKTQMAELHHQNVRVRFLGDASALAVDIQEQMRALAELTGENTGLNLNIAINYGGRDELARAVRKIARDAVSGGLEVAAIDETSISLALDTGGQSDPDLIIRTAGELRLSNFLTWQSAYAELAFVDETWPEFDAAVMARALDEFSNRSRRFGGVKPSIPQARRG